MRIPTIGPQCLQSVNLKSSSMSMKLPQGLLFLENWHFLNFKIFPFSKSVYFLILSNFSKNGAPGQTTMLTRRAAKFCVEPRSPFSNISQHDPKTLGKLLIIVSWPERRPEFPSDGGGVPTSLNIWRSPGPTCPGTKYPVRGIPHFDQDPTWMGIEPTLPS